MTKTLTVENQRSNAERQLFTARRALSHLVEMYDNGQWRIFTKKKRRLPTRSEARAKPSKRGTMLSRLVAVTPTKSGEAVDFL
jgi:hypothetical protein